MSRKEAETESYYLPIRRFLLGLTILICLGLLLLWRIDSPRVERFRSSIIDKVMPSFDWALAPVTGIVNIARDFQSYQRIYQQNQELRREIQRMRIWREAALQLEQENARLKDLAELRLDPALTYVTGVVLSDSGSPFRQSVLLNLGRDDSVQDGWAVMDGIGLVGRISGVGSGVSRVLLLTDSSSAIPAEIQPSGETSLVIGDNRAAPKLDFVENIGNVQPGDRVISSGDGGIFPPGILIGQVAREPSGQLRVRPAADLSRLTFLRVLRTRPQGGPQDAGSLIAPTRTLPLSASPLIGNVSDGQP